MREAQHVGSSAAPPANAKSATHSFSRGRYSGFHKNLPVSFQFNAEIPRFDSSTSRAPRYTSQHISNASSGFTLIASPLSCVSRIHPPNFLEVQNFSASNQPRPRIPSTNCDRSTKRIFIPWLRRGNNIESHCVTQPVFPDRPVLHAAQNLRRFPLALLHHERAILRFPQMV